MANIALWKIVIAYIPSLLSFLFEFSAPSDEEDGSQKKQPRVLALICIALAFGLWYTVTESTSLSDQMKKDKTTIASLTKQVTALSIEMNREKAAKERKTDQIDLLKARLKESDSDNERLDRVNQRLIEDVAGLETKLSLCQGRAYVCEPYKPSLGLLVELGKITDGGE